MSKEKELQQAVLSDEALKQEALNQEEEWRRTFNEANGISDDLLEFVPEGFHPYKAIGRRNVEKRIKLGYEIAKYPSGHKLEGRPIKLTGFHEGYLMLIPIERKRFYEAEKARQRKAQQTKDMDDAVKQSYGADGSELYRKISEREKF